MSANRRVCVLRQSYYCDKAGLEAIRGRFKQAHESIEEPCWANATYGAYQAIRTLLRANEDGLDVEGFFNVWTMLMKEGEEVGTE